MVVDPSRRKRGLEAIHMKLRWPDGLTLLLLISPEILCFPEKVDHVSSQKLKNPNHLKSMGRRDQICF